MKRFTFHAVVFCLYSIQLLPSSTKGVILTKNIPVACPGETLIYTCVSEGFIQRWRLHPSADSSTTLAEISFQDGIDVAGRTTIIMNQFNFTLILTDYNNFTSMLTFIASEMHSNIAIECASPLSFGSESVGIIEIPRPPHYFEIISKEYHKNFSLVTLEWSPLSLNQSQEVDFYRMMVQTEGFNNITSFICWINSTETMITVSTLAYNSNITLSLTAHNCVGESQAVILSYRAMRCDVINSSVLLINGSLSQIPGSRVKLTCTFDPLFSVVVECQEDGSWQPNPTRVMCDYDLYVSTNAFFTLSPRISKLPVAYVSVYVSVGVVFLLLVSLGLSVSLCQVTRQRCTKKLAATSTPMASTDIGNSTHVYEEVSPVYETLSITVTDMGEVFQEKDLNEQELFTHTGTGTQASNFTSGCIAEGIDMVDNEAYNHSLPITKATDNSSQQTSGEHDYVCTSIEEGLFEPLYDDTVI